MRPTILIKKRERHFFTRKLFRNVINPWLVKPFWIGGDKTSLFHKAFRIVIPQEKTHKIDYLECSC